MPKDQYYEAALAYAQSQGFRGNTLPHFNDSEQNRIGANCPLARAIPGAVVGCESITIGRTVSQLPKEVARFVEFADKGHYADVVGKPWALR